MIRPTVASRLPLAAALALCTLLAAGTAHASCSDRPGTPTDITAQALSPSSIILKWRATTKGGERPLGMDVNDIEVTDAQGKVLGLSMTGKGFYAGRNVFEKLDFNKQYCFRIRARTEFGTQGCVSQNWSARVCATTPSPPLGGGTSSNGCPSGRVPRQASSSDKVCVTPASRALVQEENRLAASRRSPNGGAYGPNTCKQGFVWREAFNGDVVCVTPARRTAVKAENTRQ